MKLLHEMVGEEIMGIIPMISRDRIQLMILHGVDDGGIWVESQALTDLMLGVVCSAPL
jgi:hypothetical protein